MFIIVAFFVFALLFFNTRKTRRDFPHKVSTTCYIRYETLNRKLECLCFIMT